MAESEPIFRVQNDQDEEELIQRRNVLAVIPGDNTPFSKLVHIVNDPDSEGLPIVKTSNVLWSNPHTPLPIDADNHVIISTGSGTGKALQFFTQAAKPLLDTYYSNYTVHETKSATTITELTTNIFFPAANGGRSIRIILLSGDGGVIDVVNALISSIQPAKDEKFKAPEVVVLPLGTGNALANSVGANRDHTFGLSTLVNGKPRQLPLFKASFSSDAILLVDEARREEELPKDPVSGAPTIYGAVVASWGMHASLVADSDTAEYRKFGVDRFKMAAKEALYPADGSPPHSYKAKVSMLKPGGNEWEPIPRDEHMYILATLVSNLEKTFTISPASKPADGHLRLVHFGPTSGDEAMKIMGLAYQGGQHVKDPTVGYEDIEGLKIKFEGEEEDARWRRICIEGKIVRVGKDGWMEVRRGAAAVLQIVCSQ